MSFSSWVFEPLHIALLGRWEFVTMSSEKVGRREDREVRMGGGGGGELRVCLSYFPSG